jgi:hypothetical protein
MLLLLVDPPHLPELLLCLPLEMCNIRLLRLRDPIGLLQEIAGPVITPVSNLNRATISTGGA